MKFHILPAVKLTIVCILFFTGVYTMVVWGIGQLVAPNHGQGETINYPDLKGKTGYGFSNIGQSFNAEKYFWSRPSAVAYNAAGSGASNKGATNQEYLAQVQARIDTFMVHNPSVRKSDIPVEMVTASGSGLDPDISPKAAMIQVLRIAKVRNVDQDKIISLVNEHIEKPLFGLFGPSKVNVLKLNVALDQFNNY
jgi:potassium-transporting ATPase KdpC subunit